MNKLRIGMYVRSAEYGIGKVDYICDCEGCINRGYKEPHIVFAADEIYITSEGYENELSQNASYDIIDLIEVGDLVLIEGNIYQVYKDIKNELRYFDRNYVCSKYLKYADIDSVITKEQLEQSSFEVTNNKNKFQFTDFSIAEFEKIFDEFLDTFSDEELSQELKKYKINEDDIDE